MKIGEPVTNLPAGVRDAKKYALLYDAVEALKEGQILPAECESAEEARAVMRGVRVYLMSRGHLVNQRGSTVYITRNGSRADL